jgi:ribonuclease P protein component
VINVREAGRRPPGRANIPALCGPNSTVASGWRKAREKRERRWALRILASIAPGRLDCFGLGRARHADLETHVSTKEAQASAHPRVPYPDAYACRPAHSEAPSREGPQATDGVMYQRPGARRRPGGTRLSRSADFDRVFRHGRSHASRELVLYVFPRESEGPPRLGLSVSRKVGGAVDRNKVKRLLREAFALEGSRLPPGSDAVIVARADARALAEREGLDGIQAVLRDLIARAGGSGDVAEGVGERSDISSEDATERAGSTAG